MRNTAAFVCCWCSIITVSLIPFTEAIPPFAATQFGQSNQKITIVSLQSTNLDPYYDEDTDSIPHLSVLPSSRFSNQNSRFTVENEDTQRAMNPLLKQANTASIGLLFILLLWRTVSCFEMVDSISSSYRKTLILVPASILAIANAVGFVVNLIRPLNFKNHLKFIVALNLMRESTEIVYNILMVLFSSSREVFLGRFFVSCWWLFLCFSFSKSRWVLETIIPNVQQFQEHSGQQRRQHYR